MKQVSNYTAICDDELFIVAIRRSRLGQSESWRNWSRAKGQFKQMRLVSNYTHDIVRNGSFQELTPASKKKDFKWNGSEMKKKTKHSTQKRFDRESVKDRRGAQEVRVVNLRL